MFSLATVKIITKVKCLLEAIIDNQVEKMHSRLSSVANLLRYFILQVAGNNIPVVCEGEARLQDISC